MLAVDFRRVAQDDAHRPWPVPGRPWVMTMTWTEVLFLHYRVPIDVLRPLVPPCLPIDVHDGTGWVSVVPFRMWNVGPRGVPSLPWLSAFPEVNVRTYVTIGERPGVYFFSLDAARLPAVVGARAAFGLRYFWADMAALRSEVDGLARVAYRSRRRGPGAPAVYEATYGPRPGTPRVARPGTLDHFLVERYCLYTARGGVPARLEINHRPWPLFEAEAVVEADTLRAAAGLPAAASPDLAHYSERVDVVGWLPRRA